MIIIIRFDALSQNIYMCTHLKSEMDSGLWPEAVKLRLPQAVIFIID